MGAGRSPLGLLPLPFNSRFLGLNAKAKKRRINTTKKEYLPTVQFYVFSIGVHFVSYFNEDNFTKTVFMFREDRDYLFTGSAASVCCDT